ncbi:apurinic/apyrimidinic endonuclease [Theileria orientalis strain Shintoku]|uniref:Apurinic/apyrimidinic endonuclease n=1 Tax=Theileria orientalis strain Shintoku TaxID=869250 RepID=J4D798_THEOR|nr:apurinic/apyrimidinic endonuclease [Theileria orientalis strain Shintoku]BAM40050.1 apurinic/apyrimidinic endonuclease [Theileria orientalis strain Shintoku]|eukprot:XP_009690351.1 apurinic/apyrimidinic endonuclease [Theileria orientalis strain Shintoku]
MLLNVANSIGNLTRYSPFCFVNKKLLQIPQDYGYESLIMVKKQPDSPDSKSKLVKTEVKKTSKAETSKSAKKTKKADAKSLVQTKIEFSSSSPTKWAVLPPYDPNLDVKTEFQKLVNLRNKSHIYVGAHVSASGGPDVSVVNSFNVLGQSFALFLKNQRSWNFKPLSPEWIAKFKKNLETFAYDPRFILPHASYLINVANPDANKRKKAFENFLDDIKRCEKLGIQLYNFHPGSTCGLCEKEEGIMHISDCINEALHLSSGVTIVLENAAGQNNVIGSKFEDLRDIINQVKDKTRVGVCLDTCHLFAAGFDIRTHEKFEAVMKSFDDIVGLKYLKAVHLNDSKSDLGSGLDRHENIGKGKLTKETFEFIMNSGYFKEIPIILETPTKEGDESVYRQEIQLMYSLYKG